MNQPDRAFHALTFDEFTASFTQSAPPDMLSKPLQALWYEGRNDWDAAHEIAQSTNSPVNCWIHAYLHRKEGDTWNTNYWYTRAGRTMPRTSLAEEWESMVKELLAENK